MMKQFRRTVAFVAVFLAATFTMNVRADSVDFASFAHFVTFTVGDSYTGGALANFPVLVRVSSAIDGVDMADFAADGGDIRFADADGNLIPHEIDTWNPAGESLIWVKLPSMVAGATFKMFYCPSGSLPDALPTTSVWSQYAGVWHFGEASGTAYDATANNLDAAVCGAANKDAWSIGFPGLLGSARQIGNGTASDASSPLLGKNASFVLVPKPATSLGNTFTISGWCKLAFDVGGYPRLFDGRTNSGTGPMPFLQFAKSNTALAARGGNNTGVYNFSNFPDSTQDWVQFVAVFNGTKLTIYANGSKIGESSVTAASGAFSNGLAFGSNPNGNEAVFTGWFDEFRLNDNAVSADWAQAEYRTMSDAGFLSGTHGVNEAFILKVNTPAYYDSASGKWKISVDVLSGSGDISGKVVDVEGNETALAPKTGVGVGSYEFEIDGLAADAVYNIVFTGTDGTEVAEYDGGSFFTGTITLTTGDTASPDFGTFILTRNVTAGEYTLVYEIGGTAVAGVDYEALPGSVTFADGSATAMVKVVKKEGAVSGDEATIVLSFGDKEATLMLSDLERKYGSEDFAYGVRFKVGNGYTGAALNEFPVLVRVSSAIEGVNMSDFAADGSDIRFMDATDHLIPHEIDTWNPDGESLIWVRLPSMVAGATFKMLYCPLDSLPEALPTTSVWSQYLGVWHFNEDGGTAYDASGNQLDAEVKGSASASEQSIGVTEGTPFGSAMRQNGDSANFAVVGNASSYLLIPADKVTATGIGNVASFSGWFKLRGNDAAYPRIYAAKDVNGTDKGPQLQFDKGSTMSYVINAGNSTKNYFTVPDVTQNWLHFVNVYNGKSITAFHNGGSANSQTLGAAIASWAKGLAFGSNTTGSEFAACGWFDEFRLRDSASSSDWARAEYLTMTDATLVSGTLEATSGITVTEAVISGNSSDGFALDVNLSGEATGSLSSVIVAPDGNATTNLVTDSAVKGEYSIPLTLAADTCYRIGALMTYGGKSNLLMADEAVYTGDISITAGGNAVALGGVSGSFTISRAATADACAYDLVVYYTVGGTAVNGTDFEPLTGVVTIPAGESTVTIDIVPRMRGGSPTGMTLNLALAEGQYGIAQAAASAGITVDGIGEAWVLSADNKTITDGDWILNVSFADGKATVTGIATVGTGTTLRLAWDVMDTAGNRYPIRAIGNSAFKDNTVIKLVTFRDDLERIGANAFQNCTNLGGEYRFGFNGPFEFGKTGSYSDGYNFANSRIEKVELGPGVTKLMSYVFKDNPSLKSVVLPPALAAIPGEAFENCTSLTTVTPFLPETVKHIDVRAFYNCTSLTGDLQFASAQGSKFGAPSDGNAYTFAGTKITSATIGDGFTGNIPSYTFNLCTALKTVRLPDVFSGNIGWYAFDGCTALETVTPLLPYGVGELGCWAFGGCTSLTGDLVINGSQPFKFSLKGGNSQAFLGAKLDSVYFGANVTNVAAQVFSGCTAIKEMRFEEMVPVAANAFGSLPDYQSRLYLSRASDSCKEFIEDTAKVTPWSSLAAATQKLYTDAYPEEKLPRGLTTDASNLKKQWVFFFTPASAEVNATMIMLK